MRTRSCECRGPAVSHEPGQCPGDRDVRLYLCGFWLCSSCAGPDDVAVALGSDEDDQGGEA